MEELLVFSDNKTGEKIGMYYNAWLFIIRCILVKYGHKTEAEADEILKKHYYKRPEDYDDIIYLSHETEYHWAMLGAYGEQYWLKGMSAEVPTDYNEWYENCINDNHLTSLFEWF